MLHAHVTPGELQPCPQAVARLASVRQALRLVSPFGAGPAPDDDQHDEEVVAAAWDSAGVGRKALFERRSERMVGAVSAGVEALVAERDDGREPNWAASDALVDEIRRELREVAGIICG